MEDFFSLKGGKYGKGVLNNTKTKIILNLEHKEAEVVKKELDLSEAEMLAITRFERGNALISTNNNNLLVEFKASRLEKDLITTDRKDLKELKERLEKYGETAYEKKNYESEQKAVIQLAALSRYPIKRYDVEKWISGLESKENIQLAEKQRKGVEMVFQNPVSIITGGPGSGKTTLLRFIVMIQEKLNMDSMILLAAPTGRARQRMYEATGYPALTIHKSIGLTGAEGEEAWNGLHLLF